MTSQDPTSPKQPLDAEERAVAERLARIGPHGEPSPALDSKILSAAHAAVGNRSGGEYRHAGTRASGQSAKSPRTDRHRHRPRWPLGLGIAASIVLAIGLGWQMRPLPDATPAYRSEADSALASAPGESKQAAEPATRLGAPPQSTPVAPLPAEPLAAGAGPSEAKPTGTRSTENAAMAADENPAATRDQGAPATPAQTRQRMQEQQTGLIDHEPESQPALTAPLSQPSPPAAPAPAAPVTKPAFTAPLPDHIVFDAFVPAAPAQPTAGMAVTTLPSATGGSLSTVSADKRAASQAAAARGGAAAQAAATSKANAEARMQAARAGAPPPAQPEAFKNLSAAGAADYDMPAEDVPPATVASPLVRDAWLARIRTLASQGRVEDARASLRVFVLRYPGYPLPTDLRTLQDTIPAHGPAPVGKTPDP